MSHEVFLCSSTRELLDHSDSVFRLLCSTDSEWTCIRSEQAEGYDASEVLEESRTLIRQAELCVAIVGHLCGKAAGQDGQSLPAAEVEYARTIGKEVLVFMASEDFQLAARFLKDLNTNELKRQRDFRRAVFRKAKDRGTTVNAFHFDSLEDLCRQVEVEFHRWLRRRLFVESPIEDHSTSNLVRDYIYAQNIRNERLLYTIFGFKFSYESFQDELSLNNMREDPLMTLPDITPFVPVIVEAMRFLFNEVSSWIDEVRRKSSDPTSSQFSNLQVSENRFGNYQDDPESLRSAINAARAQMDAREIQSLVSQIRRQRSVFNNLEEVAITATGGTAARLNTEIAEISDQLVLKVERLEALLDGVFQQESGNASASREV